MPAQIASDLVARAVFENLLGPPTADDPAERGVGPSPPQAPGSPTGGTVIAAPQGIAWGPIIGGVISAAGALLSSDKAGKSGRGVKALQRERAGLENEALARQNEIAEQLRAAITARSEDISPEIIQLSAATGGPAVDAQTLRNLVGRNADHNTLLALSGQGLGSSGLNSLTSQSINDANARAQRDAAIASIIGDIVSAAITS